MTGSHKFLSYVAISESIMNIGFSILFIKLIGIVGIAIGTLIPNVILGIFVIFPKAAKYSQVSIKETISRIYLPLALVCIPPLLFVSYFNYITPLHKWNFITLVMVSILMAILYLIPAWFLMLSSEERKLALNRINKFSLRK